MTTHEGAAPASEESGQVDQAHLAVDMKLTTTEGVIVPIKVLITYPKGYGFYAVKGVECLVEGGNLYTEMINRQDFSTLRVLASSADERQS